MDPLSASYPWYTPYQFAGNMPIWAVDLDGAEPLPNFDYNDNLKKGEGEIKKTDCDELYYHCGTSITKPGLYKKGDYLIVTGKAKEGVSSERRTQYFIGFNPRIAWEIGEYTYGGTDITDAGGVLALNAKFNERKYEYHESTKQNAFRHAVWQGIITNVFGETKANEAGDVHEANPFLHIQKPYNDDLKFENPLEGDNWVDLMNNHAGREAMATSFIVQKEYTRKDVAFKILNVFKEKGLWMLEKQKDGTFKPILYKLTNSEYKNAKKNLIKTDKNGYNAADGKHFRKDS